jgi:hypothetical protein
MLIIVRLATLNTLLNTTSPAYVMATGPPL